MSPVTILPVAPPEWDYNEALQYPTENATAGAAGFVEWTIGGIGAVGGLQNQGVPKQGFQFFEHFGIVAGLTEDVAFHRGVICAQTSVTGAARQQFSLGAVDCMPVTGIADLTAGVLNPSWRRIFWLSAAIAIDSGTLDRNTGLLFIPFGAQQLSTVWPSGAAGNNGGFGIVGDGAGGWSWGMYSTGASPGNIIEEVALPQVADAEDWNLFEFVVISGATLREASVELRINGATILTRDWVNAPAVPPYLSTTFVYHPSFRIGTPSGDRLMRGQVEWRNGRFLPNGSELLS